MGNNLKLLDYVILKMCYFLLLVDSVNGFFANKGAALPISSLYKFVLLGILLYRLLKLKRSSPIWYLTYIAAIFLYYALYDFDLFSISFSFISRYLIIIILYEYFIQLIKQYNISRYLYKIIKFNFIVLVCNILLGLLGIGYGTYDNFGSKGFFYAGNETSGVLLTLAPVILYIAIKKFSIKSLQFVVIMAICLISAVLLGTKSALLGIFIILFYIIWKYSRIKKMYILSFITCIITGVCYYIYHHFSFMLDRFLFAFDKRDKGWMALLSGREEFYETNMTEFYSSNPIGNFFGLGMPDKTIEIDFFDFLFIGGYLAMFLLITLWIINLRKSYKKGEIPSLIFFTNLLLIGISFVAGHIYSSAMAGPFIAIINILPMIETQFSNIIKGSKIIYHK